MYIPTIFMGKDANEETPEKNSMDWLGAHNRPGRLSIFGCLALWILWVFDTVLRDEPSRSPKNMVFFSWVNPTRGWINRDDQAIWLP